MWEYIIDMCNKVSLGEFIMFIAAVFWVYDKFKDKIAAIFGKHKEVVLETRDKEKYLENLGKTISDINETIDMLEKKLTETTDHFNEKLVSHVGTPVWKLFPCNAGNLGRSQLNRYNKICYCHILLLFFGTNNLIVEFEADAAIFVPADFVQPFFIKGLQAVELIFVVAWFP